MYPFPMFKRNDQKLLEEEGWRFVAADLTEVPNASDDTRFVWVRRGRMKYLMRLVKTTVEH